MPKYRIFPPLDLKKLTLGERVVLLGFFVVGITQEITLEMCHGDRIVLRLIDFSTSAVIGAVALVIDTQRRTPGGLGVPLAASLSVLGTIAGFAEVWQLPRELPYILVATMLCWCLFFAYPWSHRAEHFFRGFLPGSELSERALFYIRTVAFSLCIACSMSLLCRYLSGAPIFPRG